MSILPQTSVQEATERARQYRFLASLYLQPPTAGLLDELKKLGWVGGEEDLETIQQEFEKLFIVPLSQYTTPYEAVYRDEREVAGKKVRGLLMGPSTVDVTQQYRDCGAKMDQAIKELPDHIGVELAFMEFLCEREAEARQKGAEPELKEILRREQRFLHDHLKQWVSLLAESIRKKSRISFYKRISDLMVEVIHDDLEFITPLEEGNVQSY